MFPYKIEWEGVLPAAAPLLEALGRGARSTPGWSVMRRVHVLRAAANVPVEGDCRGSGNRRTGSRSWCRKSSAIKSFDDLRGKKIASGSRLDRSPVDPGGAGIQGMEGKRRPRSSSLRHRMPRSPYTHGLDRRMVDVGGLT